MTTSRNFGAAASDYATHRAGFPDSLFDRLAALGLGVNAEWVADVGAGTGSLGRGFARRGCRVTAIDPDARMLEQGRVLNAEAGVVIDDQVGAAEALPFDDNALDIVAAGQCWHWFDPLAAAREYAAQNRSSSLLVWHRGRLQSADYWGGTAATPVNSRSLHKMLGGLLVGAAIQDGHIGSLDDPVAKYVTEWQGTPKAAITIRNVLQMSSGLMWFRQGGALSTASRRYIDPHWDRVLLQDVPLEFTPGSAYDYSDITADVMPHLIQRATGRRYAQYLDEALLKPLHAPGGKLWINREGGMPHGGCCLMLPPEAWLRIGLLTLDEGRAGGRQLLPPWWTTEMRRPSPNNPHFGLMMWLGQPYAQRRLYHRPDSPSNAVPRPGVFHSEPYLADDLYLFDGMNGQLVYVVPSQQLVIVRTGLRPAPGKPEWDNAKLPNLILRALGAGGAPTSTSVAVATPQPAAPRADRTLGERLAAEARFWWRWSGIKRQSPASLPRSRPAPRGCSPSTYRRRRSAPSSRASSPAPRGAASRARPCGLPPRPTASPRR
jgi:CubicO group peptidase (beta-lactamase class C family)